jgi:hypothetical protein
MTMRLYLWQRATAALMVPLVLLHIAVIFYATRNGMTAADILSRTHGSILWASYYGLFVAAASIHASIGARTSGDTISCSGPSARTPSMTATRRDGRSGWRGPPSCSESPDGPATTSVVMRVPAADRMTWSLLAHAHRRGAPRPLPPGHPYAGRHAGVGELVVMKPVERFDPEG